MPPGLATPARCRHSAAPARSPGPWNPSRIAVRPTGTHRRRRFQPPGRVRSLQVGSDHLGRRHSPHFAAWQPTCTAGGGSQARRDRPEVLGERPDSLGALRRVAGATVRVGVHRTHAWKPRPLRKDRGPGYSESAARRPGRKALPSAASPTGHRQVSPDAFEAEMSQEYELTVAWSQEDAAFVVDVPELPGCMAPAPLRRKP